MKSSFKELEEKVEVAKALSSGLMGLCFKCYGPVELGEPCLFCDGEERELDDWDKEIIKNFPGTMLNCLNCGKKVDPRLKYCPRCREMMVKKPLGVV